ILDASTRPDDGLTGFDDTDKPVNFDPDPKKKPKKKPDEKKHEGPWQSLVVVGRDGDIEMPADVVLTFTDGQTVKRMWGGASGWIKYRVTSSSPLVKAEVDPERRIVLDRNPWNNARYTERHEGPSDAAKGRTYARHLVEILLSTLWGVLLARSPSASAPLFATGGSLPSSGSRSSRPRSSRGTRSKSSSRHSTRVRSAKPS